MFNTESARRASIEVSSTTSDLDKDNNGWETPATSTGHADAFRAYEENIGILSPMIRQSILAELENFTDEQITHAIRIAVENESRSWSFVAGVLRRWARDGIPMSEQTEQPEQDPTESAFRRLNSADTWTRNGNGIAQANGSAGSPRTEIAPECDRCNDSLWVLASADSSGGNLVVVPCSCQATLDNTRSQLRTYSQLGHLERMTFDALIPEGRSGRADEALFRAATETAEQFASEPSDWLVFEGSTGSGKTHLAAAIVNAIIDRGSPAKYVSALDIPDILRNERFEDDDAESGTFESLLDAPTLVIDDLGAQQATNWIDSKIDQLLTHRFNGRLPTVIVLAKPVSEMPERIALKLDDPSLSRVFQLTSGSETNESKRVNIPTTMLERMTFESFNPDGAPAAKSDERASLAIAFTAAREFAENPEKWLYLHGPPVSVKHISPLPSLGYAPKKAIRSLYGQFPIC